MMTEEELTHITPLLAKLQNKKSGFICPDGYLEEVENTVLTRLQMTDNDVPKDYFDTIEEVVFKRLEQEQKTKGFSPKKYWLPLAVAASLAILFTFYNPFTNENPREIAEIERWVETGYLDLNSYEIATIFDINTEEIILDNTIYSEDLENYLNETVSESLFYD